MHRQTKTTKPPETIQAKKAIPPATPRQVLINAVNQKTRARLLKEKKAKPEPEPKPDIGAILASCNAWYSSKYCPEFLTMFGPDDAESFFVYEMIKRANRPDGLFNANLEWVQSKNTVKIDPIWYAGAVTDLVSRPWIAFDPATGIMLDRDRWTAECEFSAAKGRYRTRKQTYSVLWVMLREIGPSPVLAEAIASVREHDRLWKHLSKEKRDAFSALLDSTLDSIQTMVTPLENGGEK